MTLARIPRLWLFGLMISALTAPQSFCAQETGAPTTVLNVSGGAIDVTFPTEPMKLSQKELTGWVEAAAHAVSLFYGHFPVSHLTLLIRSGNGTGVGHGVTFARGGGLIRISVGREATLEDLKDDWVLTHEMTHLAFPSMPDDQHWIEEGLATYIEPVARAAAGQFPVSEVWRTFARDMPKGEPEAGDRGLDNTHTWGRTYWGGALFCLVADVTIRERTHNNKSLQDALRSILDHGGTIAEEWSIEKTLEIGDRATGTRVLEDLYKQMAERPVTVDLDQLWVKLGVSVKDGQVIVNKQAKDATILASITAPKK